MNRDEAMKILAECRVKIDAIDLELVDLLNRRTRIVEDIGRAKEVAQLPIYEPRREDDVYRNVLSRNGGPLSADALRRIFERIIDEMRAQQKMRLSAKGDSEC
jgi:chorismate mutase